jgi:hypothetical protein
LGQRVSTKLFGCWSSALGYSVVKGGVHRYEWATCRVRTSTVFVHSVGMLAMGNSPCSPCAHPKPTNQQLNTRLVPSHDGPSRHPSETSWPHAMGDVTARALTCSVPPRRDEGRSTKVFTALPPSSTSRRGPLRLCKSVLPLKTRGCNRLTGSLHCRFTALG